MCWVILSYSYRTYSLYMMVSAIWWIFPVKSEGRRETCMATITWVSEHPSPHLHYSMYQLASQHKQQRARARAAISEPSLPAIGRVHQRAIPGKVESRGCALDLVPWQILLQSWNILSNHKVEYLLYQRYINQCLLRVVSILQKIGDQNMVTLTGHCLCVYVRSLINFATGILVYSECILQFMQRSAFNVYIQNKGRG